MPHPYPFADLDLARRLERTEGAGSVAFVEARAALEPSVGAAWIESAGAYAMFDGVGSPLTQTFGLGLFEPVTDEGLEALEDFFTSRGARVCHEVSPLAGPAALSLLAERGYRPIELTSVLYRPVAAGPALPPAGPGVETRLIEPGEEDLWADVSALGWAQEQPDLQGFLRDFGRVAARSRGARCFLAEAGGEPLAAGSLVLGDSGVALLAGASTIPAHRRRGAQRALLEARLGFAAAHGCDTAMMGAEPGSASQRNAERQGFRIAYTRIKWALPV